MSILISRISRDNVKFVNTYNEIDQTGNAICGGDNGKDKDVIIPRERTFLTHLHELDGSGNSGFAALHGGGGERRDSVDAPAAAGAADRRQSMWNTGSIIAQCSPSARLASGTWHGLQNVHQRCVSGSAAMCAMSAAKSVPWYSQ